VQLNLHDGGVGGIPPTQPSPRFHGAYSTARCTMEVSGIPPAPAIVDIPLCRFTTRWRCGRNSSDPAIVNVPSCSRISCTMEVLEEVLRHQPSSITTIVQLNARWKTEGWNEWTIHCAVGCTAEKGGGVKCRPWPSNPPSVQQHDRFIATSTMEDGCGSTPTSQL
jgi:hypothetical protein